MADNYFGITDTGRQRTNNEDTFIAEKVLKDQYIMACVIDGVGGYSGGEVAAAMARQSILEYFTVPSGDVPTMLKEAFIAANKKIYKERHRSAENEQMACVLTIAVVDSKNKQFYYAHVGDTRLYLFRDASLIKVTKDHSFVGFLEDTGRLTEEGAMQHPKRNEINKALGFDEQIAISSDYIETGSSPFLPGDLLLLCSDGLTDMVNKAEIIQILTADKTLEEKGKELINAANNRGGKDNITAVLVYNDDAPIKLKATRPKVVKKKEQQKPEQASEPCREITVEKVSKAAPAKKSNNKTFIIISIVGLLLLSGLAYLFFSKKNTESLLPAPTAIQANEQQINLQDSIDYLATGTLLLQDSLYTQPFLLNDTLFLNKDSLHLKGVGNFVFTGDSLFKGPAMVVDSNARYVLLENITFQNFDVAILAGQKGFHLKNVRFRNCRIPVQNGWTFPEGVYVSGPFSDSALFKTDSLPK